MKNTVLFLSRSLCGLFIACQPPAADQPMVDLDAVRAELQGLEDAYAKASNERNVDGILGYYADDAQRLPDGEPTIKGKDAIRQHALKEIAADTSGAKVRFEVVDVFAEGNLAVEVGRYIGTAPDGSEDRGKYMAIFEKRDGKYVCIRDIWNSDSDDDDEGDGDDED